MESTLYWKPVSFVVSPSLDNKKVLSAVRGANDDMDDASERSLGRLASFFHLLVEYFKH